MIYVIEFIFSYFLLLYYYWESPGLFPFNILFHGIIVLFVVSTIFFISISISNLLVKFIKVENESDKFKLKKFSFTVIFVILYLMFFALSGLA